ncbi:MAG: hypothetical protein ACLPN6_00165 [Streptosporangiaceae bacterium]|jgi:hypothetical protein
MSDGRPIKNRSSLRRAHRFFDDKANILGAALVLSHRRVGARMDAEAAGRSGLAALRVVMLEALPLDQSAQAESYGRELRVS